MGDKSVQLYENKDKTVKLYPRTVASEVFVSSDMTLSEFIKSVPVFDVILDGDTSIETPDKPTSPTNPTNPTDPTDSLTAIKEDIDALDESISALKNDTYTKEEVDKAIADAAFNGIDFAFRDVLEGEVFEVSTEPAPTILVTGVRLNKTTTIVGNGSTDVLVATVLPSNATNKSITWSSSNTSIATVNNGVISGVANGTCNITVTTVDGEFTATCSVNVQTVNISLESIGLNRSTSTLKINETEQLSVTFNPTNATNKNVTWSSSDDSKATVANGLVTAKAEGSAVITCTSSDGNKTATCNVTVQAEEVVLINGTSVTDNLWGAWDLTEPDTSVAYSQWLDLSGNNNTIKTSTLAHQIVDGGAQLTGNVPKTVSRFPTSTEYSYVVKVKWKSSISSGLGGMFGGFIILNNNTRVYIDSISADITIEDTDIIVYTINTSTKTAKLYKNGVLAGSCEKTTLANDSFWILCNTSQRGVNVGYKALVYKKELSQSEISTIQNEIGGDI